MSEKYYVIMCGEYSDTGFVGITKDLKLAEAYCKVRNEQCKSREEYWIWNSEGEELITDENIIKQAEKIEVAHIYELRLSENENGCSWKLSRSRSRYEKTDSSAAKVIVVNKLRRDLYVYTEDEEKAKKIMRDYIAKLNAEEQGL